MFLIYIHFISTALDFLQICYLRLTNNWFSQMPKPQLYWLVASSSAQTWLAWQEVRQRHVETKELLQSCFQMGRLGSRSEYRTSFVKFLSFPPKCKCQWFWLNRFEAVFWLLWKCPAITCSDSQSPKEIWRQQWFWQFLSRRGADAKLIHSVE